MWCRNVAPPKTDAALVIMGGFFLSGKVRLRLYCLFAALSLGQPWRFFVQEKSAAETSHEHGHAQSAEGQESRKPAKPA